MLVIPEKGRVSRMAGKEVRKTALGAMPWSMFPDPFSEDQDIESISVSKDMSCPHLCHKRLSWIWPGIAVGN